MATKKVANKSTKKVSNKFDFSDSIKAVKGTAKTVNNQVKDAAGEVIEDIRENGVQLREVAVSRAKNTYKKAYKSVTEVTETVAENVSVNKIAEATKKVNQYTLKTAEELVEGAATNGEKWQGVAHKAVKGGLKLAAKQQDIVFDTLETIKGQFAHTAKRFKKLVTQ
jgi:hypothetical protein